MENTPFIANDTQHIWSRESDDKLFELREMGLSFSKIGLALGKTKNSVIGRYGRLKVMRENYGENIYRRSVPAVNDDEVKTIIELRKRGFTTPAIARIIKRSQDAVRRQIKLHFQDEQPKPEASPRSKIISFAPFKEFKSTKLEAYQAFSDTGGVSMADLRPDQCRWPLGDPRTDEFRFCGASAFSGRAYCCQHHAIAYYRSPTTAAQRRDAERSHNRSLAGGLR